MTLNRVLLVLAVVCLVVAFIVTAGFGGVHSDVQARDEWLIGGLALFAASFLP